MKKKMSKNKQERLNFLKFELPHTLDSIEIELRKGQIIDAFETLKKLRERHFILFPFKYGSEVPKGYSDEEILES